MISKSFEESFTQVQPLVEKFRADEKHYLESKYQEAEVRQEFLDKFFVALGWDVYHDEQANPYEREVRIEKSVMVQGRGKRADYAFYNERYCSSLDAQIDALVYELYSLTPDEIEIVGQNS